jgi:hypothetical protein
MTLGPQVDPPNAAKLALYDKLYAKQMASLGAN